MMNNLFTELRRRNIFRVAGVYAVVGWILMQVAGTLENSLNLPDWFDSAITATLLIGFPIWAFEMTPEGVKPAGAMAEGTSAAAKPVRALDVVIVGALVLVGALVIWQGTRSSPAPFETRSTNAPQDEAEIAATSNPHPEGSPQAIVSKDASVDAINSPRPLPLPCCPLPIYHRARIRNIFPTA